MMKVTFHIVIPAIDNFVNFPFKMGNSYLKELSNMGDKKKYNNNEKIFLQTQDLL